MNADIITIAKQNIEIRKTNLAELKVDIGLAMEAKVAMDKHALWLEGEKQNLPYLQEYENE
ncbi:MAG: hypothetical protein GY853_13195 [PVC group bacterium]|nr:hypothetical protein [PVC group bacterium]